MRLVLTKVHVDWGDGSRSVPVTSMPSTAAVGPLEVQLVATDGPGVAVAVGNAADNTVALQTVSLIYRLVGADEPVTMLRHGYQSWSATGAATLGLDRDPASLMNSDALAFVRSAYHADPRPAQEDELRSEWVTLLQSKSGTPLLLGFEGGSEHDGVLRLRKGEDGLIELWAQAYLGGAQLAPGDHRRLHDLVIDERADVDAVTKLTQWADHVGRRGGARVQAPYQLGWCSWYQYFTQISEATLKANLALAADWPLQLIQLDDGYQASIGDWLRTNSNFPGGLDGVAQTVTAAGKTPGLWLAPFLAAPDSRVAAAHADWLVRDSTGDEFLTPWRNPLWGGGLDGSMYGLDTTHPEVLAHLEHLGAMLVEAGFRYLKLDFAFAPSSPGQYFDPSQTPAQRVRAGFDAIRRGVGNDVLLVGCGVPLANVVGVVDANRIGPDVAPSWALDSSDPFGYLADQPAAGTWNNEMSSVLRHYPEVFPSIQMAHKSTVLRAFMHRRLWSNDPDCIMLRPGNGTLTAEAAVTWAHTVALSGGSVMVSDDLSLLDAGKRVLLDEVAAIGRQVDEAALGGITPQTTDALSTRHPTTLEGAGRRLTTDPATGTSWLESVEG